MSDNDEATASDNDSLGTPDRTVDQQAAWGYASDCEPRWPAMLAIATSVVLYVILPDRVISGLGPRWLLPMLEGVLGISLLIASPRHISKESTRIRWVAIILIAIVNFANVVTLGELLHGLLANAQGNAALVNSGRQLVSASIPVWLTNVIVFALWYWELDRGGPAARLNEVHREPDFLFPQMTTASSAPPQWSPSFFDYLYTSFTNATAFSPTDTMPLTKWAKALMMVQSLASLLTVAIVISRAINVLN